MAENTNETVAESVDRIMVGEDAVNGFLACRKEDEVINVYSRSPNGGEGGPTGEDDIFTREGFDGLVGSHCLRDSSGYLTLQTDYSGWTFDRESGELKYSSTPDRGVHQYHKVTWVKSPWAGKKAVACLGAQYGFQWGPSCFEIEDYDLTFHDCTEVLEEVILHCNGDWCYAESVGLSEEDDPTDDGTNFCMADEVRFRRVVDLCRRADRSLEDNDSDFDAAALAKLICRKFDREFPPDNDSEGHVVFTGTHSWWEIVTRNDEIETAEASSVEDYNAAARLAEINDEDAESWVCRVEKVAERHSAIHVGDYACCDGYGCDVVFVRLS